ncbi:MAG TPA: NADH/ubiquinone/plastoquinone (complex I) [Bacteroidetes bacterium]|nr:NADH/ubiquinone/plastoquinone (complex I) [Bacteroidota bacterium]
MESHYPALIVFTYVVSAILITLFAFWKERLAYFFAVLGTGTASVLSVLAFLNYLTDGSLRYFFGGWTPPIGIEFVYDGLSGFFLLVINIIALLVLIYTKNPTNKELPQKTVPYYALVMLMLVGFNGIVLTGDLFNLYVFLEISSLSSYALISIGNKKAPFSAFRYLIVGTVGGTLYLFGVGFLYTVTGTLNLIDMSTMLPAIIEGRAVFTALILMVMGIGIKAALFPMHGWLPEAYANAASGTTALIAPIGTKVAAYVLFRIFFYLFGIELVDTIVPVTYILGGLAAIGILYGSIMAIAQTDLKRMLAYSSVSQIGYIILGLSMANPWGFAGALLHVLNHAVMKASLFMVSGNLMFKEGNTDITKFNDSFRKKYPVTMASFTIAAISMVGLPPLAGFFSKWYLVLGTVENANWVFLAVILISSLLNAVYFFRIIEKVYMKNSAAGQVVADNSRRNEAPFSMIWPLTVLAVALFVIGLFNAVIVGFLMNLFPI